MTGESHRQKRFGLRSGIALAWVLALAVYIGVYVILVEPQPSIFVFTGIGPWEYEMEDQYRLIGGIGDVLFWPVNQVDRIIRPDVWHGIYDP